MAIDLTRDTRTVSDINEQAKPETTGKPSRVEKIAAALREIEDKGSFPDCVTKTPGAFLWEFYKAWVDNGGQDSGKNRNSIRRMRDHWLTDDQEVKSLHPKLTGRIRISKNDAKKLMTLFLGRSKFVGVKEGDWVLTPDGYAPFQCRDCKKLCETLADAMYPVGSEQARMGLLLPVRPDEKRLIEATSNWNTLASLYQDLDAFIILSRHNSAIGPTPSDTIRLFWDYTNYLYETILNKETVFIWVVDIGRRQVEDENSWKDFLNFEMMKTQFRAFASFDSENDLYDIANLEDSGGSVERSGIHDAFLRSLTIPEEGHREKRWKWLCERTVIVVQNLRKEEFQHLYVDEDQHVDKLRLRDIGITAENILPSMVPNRWAGLKALRNLYGGELHDISDATLEVHFNQVSGEVDDQHKRAIRYFAHALSPKLADDAPLDSVARVHELTSPGELYDEAMSLVYWAARHRLRNVERSRDDRLHEQDWAVAVAYLKNQGFRVVRLPEFMKIHRSPGD